MNKERVLFSLFVCMIVLIYPIMFMIDQLSTPGDDEYVKLGFAVENNTLYNLRLVEKDIRRKVDIFHIFQKIDEEPKLETMQQALDEGYIVLLTIEPWSGRENDSAIYSPSRVIKGSIDEDLDRWAVKLSSLDFKKGKLIVRTMHEINGNWYPWSAYIEGSSPELSKSAYVHIVERLRKENNNLIFMFGVNYKGFRYDSRTGSVQELYNVSDLLPPDEYYDIAGISGYNRYPDKWLTFPQLYDSIYANLIAGTDKPVWIAEISSVSKGGDKAEWINDMFYNVRHKYNRIEAIVWFDENKWFQDEIVDWAYDSTPQSRDVFKECVKLKNMRKI